MIARNRLDAAKELKRLKTLVRQFMQEIQWVPLRTVDCNQEKVYSLIEQLADACAATRKRQRKASK